MLSLLQRKKTPFVCSILDTFATSGTGMIMMKKYDCDLFSYAFEQKQTLTEIQTKQIFRKIVLGVKALHDLGVAHLDIKPENIFMDLSTETPYIGDFGSCVYYPRDAGSCSKGKSHVKSNLGLCGTAEYRAPEMTANPKKFDPFKIDIYSLGILFHALVTGTYPLGTQTSPDLSFESSEFIKLLITPDPNNRLSINQLVDHPFLSLHIPNSLAHKMKQLANKLSFRA